MLITYNSMGEFADHVDSLWKAGRSRRSVMDEGDWNGNVTPIQVLQYCREGNEQLAADAQAIIDNLEAQMPMTSGIAMVRSPFGGRVNYGDWQAGSPTPMRRRTKRVFDNAPIKVVVSITSSASIDKDTINKRGAAILAFLLQAQNIRPIDLWLLVELDGHSNGAEDGSVYQMIKVDSQPFAIGQAAFGLCHPAMGRMMGMTVADQYGYSGRWAADYLLPNYSDLRRQRLGLEPQDILIKECHRSDPLIDNPIAWINEQLTKISETTNEEKI